MNKKISFALSLFAACGLWLTATPTIAAEKTNDEQTVINLAGPPAPPTLPMLRLVDAQPLKDQGVTFTFKPWNDVETLMAMITGDEQQFFALPLTVSAKLFNKGVPIKLMNVNTWGVTYFVTTDKNFNSLKDLKGKTIFVPLQSSPPDAFTQYFLKQEGIDPKKDVTIQYFSPLELGNLAAAGKVEYGVLLEPHATRATMQNKELRVAFSFDSLWKKYVDPNSNIPTAGFGGKAKFIASHPELTAKIQAAYEDAVNWVKDNPAEAGELMEKTLGLKAKLVAKAIPNMGLQFVSATDAKADLQRLYTLLADFNPKMIGGSVPNEEFFYQGK